jgi:3-oxoacyl-[acyl-carrier protein] reductase
MSDSRTQQAKPFVLITGASRGIGRETALLFARSGYRVAAACHKEWGACQDLARQIRDEGGEALCLRADVSDEKDVAHMAARVTEAFGCPDVLVNNAGIAEQKLFTDITPQEWDRIFDVNCRGVFLCCRAFVPDMIRRRRGKIINLSSVWGIAGASCEVHYSASKAAVIGFSKALAKELGPSGILVNCVAPGVIDTDMNAGLDDGARLNLTRETPLERLGTPMDVARSILFLAGEGGDFITGQTLSPNGGFLI